MADYSFTVDSSFKPFSLQELLVPYQLYKDSFEQAENAYIDLSSKADKFSYLSQTLPEDSEARQIYEGYADGLREQAEDLAHHGLSMSNRRALTDYKRRYQGEIGRLADADEKLQEERKRRLTLNSNDPSTLYATHNLSIDDFLDNKEPNTYSISGNDLYKRGLEIGASSSSRIYSSPQVKDLTKMYKDVIQTQGYSPELVKKFRDNLATIPEFQKAVVSTLKEKGVTDNLTGVDYQRAMESVVNGIVNGITYKQNDNIQQNPDYITAYQKQQIAQADRAYKLELKERGLKEDKDGNLVVDKEDLPFQLQQLKNNKSSQTSGARSSSSDSGSSHTPMHGSQYISRGGTTVTNMGDESAVHGGKVRIERVNDSNNSGMETYQLKGDVTGKTYATITKDGNGNYKLTRVDPAKYSDYKKNFETDFHASYDSEYDPANIEAMGRDVINILRNEKGATPYNNYDYYLEPDNLRGGFLREGNDAGGFYRMKLGNEVATSVNDEDDSGLTPEQIAEAIARMQIKD